MYPQASSLFLLCRNPQSKNTCRFYESSQEVTCQSQSTQITWQISSMSLRPVVSRSQATNWRDGNLELAIYLYLVLCYFWFLLFNWSSHLIVAWLKGFFTCPHFTRHLWKANRDVNQCSSLPCRYLQKSLWWVLECYSERLHHHISCVLVYFTFSGAQGELKSLVHFCQLIFSTASQVFLIQTFASGFLSTSFKCFLFNQ